MFGDLENRTTACKRIIEFKNRTNPSFCATQPPGHFCHRVAQTCSPSGKGVPSLHQNVCSPWGTLISSLLLVTSGILTDVGLIPTSSPALTSREPINLSELQFPLLYGEVTATYWRGVVLNEMTHRSKATALPELLINADPCHHYPDDFRGKRAAPGGLRQWRNEIKEGPAGQSARDRAEVRSGPPYQRVVSK